MSLATHELRRETAFPEVEASMGFRFESLKRMIEFGLALVVLAATMPLILISLLLVRLSSSGPAIYRQQRLGLKGRPFTIYKIRTMCSNSEPNGPRWSRPGDPRVTPVGWLLRWSHVDELPQLYNVLRGEMSLIGPRPERPEIVAELERVIPEYRRRLLVRPGLTGLAQVLQAPDTDVFMVRRKLAFDLHYLDHLSLGLDLRILMATVLHVLHVPEKVIAWMFSFPDGFAQVQADQPSSGDANAVPFTAPILTEGCGASV